MLILNRISNPNEFTYNAGLSSLISIFSFYYCRVFAVETSVSKAIAKAFLEKKKQLGVIIFRTQTYTKKQQLNSLCRLVVAIKMQAQK